MMTLMGGASACCGPGNVNIGPCEWQCGGCEFHPDFTAKVGCTVASATGSCRQGWERAVCSCTNPCREQLLPPSPPLLLHESANPPEGYSSSRVTRRLSVINVSPGVGTLQDALNDASVGDELVLANGTYTGSGDHVLEIDKDVTIRALNPGQAVLDGGNARGVIYITSGTVALNGLNITKGSVSSCSRNLNWSAHHIALLELPCLVSDGDCPVWQSVRQLTI